MFNCNSTLIGRYVHAANDQAVGKRERACIEKSKQRIEQNEEIACCKCLFDRRNGGILRECTIRMRT